MLVSREFYTRLFKAEKSKDAYLEGCKWVANHILSKSSKVDSSIITWSLTRIEAVKDPTFKLVLYVTYDEEEISGKTCNLCKQLHSSFFINENYNCSRCNKESHKRRIEERLSIGADWMKTQISKMLDEF